MAETISSNEHDNSVNNIVNIIENIKIIEDNCEYDNKNSDDKNSDDKNVSDNDKKIRNSVESKKQYMKEYMKGYRANNKEKLKEHSIKWYNFKKNDEDYKNYNKIRAREYRSRIREKLNKLKELESKIEQQHDQESV